MDVVIVSECQLPMTDWRETDTPESIWTSKRMSRVIFNMYSLLARWQNHMNQETPRCWSHDRRSNGSPFQWRTEHWVPMMPCAHGLQHLKNRCIPHQHLFRCSVFAVWDGEKEVILWLFESKCIYDSISDVPPVSSFLVFKRTVAFPDWGPSMMISALAHWQDGQV